MKLFGKSKNDGAAELARVIAERAAREEVRRAEDAKRADKLYGLGEALLSRLDAALPPKLKYHVVFCFQGAFGDLVMDLRVPLDNEAALAQVKAEICARLGFKSDPVIVSWKGLRPNETRIHG
jgi:hypothetical protein